MGGLLEKEGLRPELRKGGGQKKGLGSEHRRKVCRNVYKGIIYSIS